MDLQPVSANGSKSAAVFLPGILLPADLRYGPLIRELGDSIQAFTKDLEVYDPGSGQGQYSIDAEIAGLEQAADRAGLDLFYLYGHSAGGAIALAFAAAQPDRLLGLALDEPASDFSSASKTHWETRLAPTRSLPAAQRLPGFLRAQVSDGVELPAPAPGLAPDWMATRPAGIEAYLIAQERHVLPAPLSRFAGPVYYSFGSLSNPYWRELRDRLATAFPSFTSEEYEGLHHLNTSHAAQPARVATSLQRLWFSGKT